MTNSQRLTCLVDVCNGSVWDVLQLSASPWTTEISTRERWQLEALTNRKATSSNRAPSTSSLCCYKVALSLYRDKRITIIRLWWPSQWLVTHGYHLAVTICLHVAATTLPSPLAWSSITYHPHFHSQFTISTLTLWFKTVFNGGCYWQGLVAFLSGPNYWGKHKRKMAIQGIN